MRVPTFISFILSVFPHLKTSLLCMANLVAEGTLGDVLLITFTCNVACLVAFETEFLMAIKRVVRVFAAKYAIQPASLVWTLPRHMAKLSTISALDCRIWVYVVPRLLTLQLGKHVVHNGIVLFFLIRFWSCRYPWFWLLKLSFLLSLRNMLSKVHVALECTTGNEQIWIPLRIEWCDIVVAVPFPFAGLCPIVLFSFAFIVNQPLGRIVVKFRFLLRVLSDYFV